VAAREFKFPDIGSFKDVEVIDVLVKAGDRVAAETPLLTLETEKATMDVPAPVAGVIEKLLVQKGSRVSAGSPMALIVEEGAAAAAPTVAAASAAVAAPTAAAPVVPAAAAPAPAIAQPPAGPVNEAGFSAAHAGPSVRAFARQLGVDLARVPGSGQKGRITQDDV